MPRKLNNWVEAFEDLTAFTGSPLRFRRWAGIACIAGALERRVWVHTKGSDLYPNIYTFLVGPPGVGKSAVLKTVRHLWLSLADQHVASSSVSKASLIDDMADAGRTLVFAGKNPPTLEFNSLKVMATELGVFLAEYASDFINLLTEFYDCEPFKERKRSMKNMIEIPKPQLNFLAGTTPSYLTQLLPEGAWDQGFLSRTILIYSGDIKPQSLFAHASADPELLGRLRADIEIIGEAFGEMKFTPEAAEFIDKWNLTGQEPRPSHPKLQHYLTRRVAHALKLCQVASYNESNKGVIELHHVQQALDWLIDAESAIPEIFKAMATGGDGKVMDEAWHMLFQYKARFNKGAPHSVLVAFLSQKTPAHNVERLIEVMEKGGMIRAVGEKNVGTVYYAKERSTF